MHVDGLAAELHRGQIRILWAGPHGIVVPAIGPVPGLGVAGAEDEVELHGDI